MSSVDVIDPLNRIGKIAIPIIYLIETRGLTEHMSGCPSRECKDLSLCLLFQRGTCRAGPRCHQVHANRAFVEHVRATASATAHCCAVHGDPASEVLRGAVVRVVILAQNNGDAASNGGLSPVEYVVPADSLAVTSGLEACWGAAVSGGLRIPSRRVCRLHSVGRCKFGKDCRNVHVCPHAWKAHPPMQRTESEISTDIDVCSVGTITPVRQRSCGLSSDDSSEQGGVQSGRSVDWESVAEELEAASVAGQDLTPFEESIRAMCNDLDRAAISPRSALRVRSNSRLFV